MEGSMPTSTAKRYFNRLVKMEPNTRKPFLTGPRRVFVDCEHDYSYTVVLPGGSVMIHSSRGGDLASYMKSLDRLLQLRPRVILPAHGPEIDDPARVILGHIEHRLMRERQIMSALRAGHTTVQAIAESIYHGLDPALMPAARENVRAHLDKLTAEGITAIDDERWTIQGG
jgi:hypothetical protein